MNLQEVGQRVETKAGLGLATSLRLLREDSERAPRILGLQVARRSKMCILDPLVRNANMLRIIPPMAQIQMWKRSECTWLRLGDMVTMGRGGAKSDGQEKSSFKEDREKRRTVENEDVQESAQRHTV